MAGVLQQYGGLVLAVGVAGSAMIYMTAPRRTEVKPIEWIAPMPPAIDRLLAKAAAEDDIAFKLRDTLDYVQRIAALAKAPWGGRSHRDPEASPGLVEMVGCFPARIPAHQARGAAESAIALAARGFRGV